MNKLLPGYYAPDGHEVDVDFYIDIWLKENPKENYKESYTDEEIKNFFFYLRGNDKGFLL